MISIIVAVDPNLLIGSNGSLPWHIKEDLIHFKNYTLNKTVIMGKTTFDSIGKPLPNRTNIIACNDADIKVEGAVVVNDLFKVLKEYKNKDEELVVIGGATIYKLSLEYADKLVISHIKKEYKGDTYFPNFIDKFTPVSKEEFEEFDVITYVKK